jgi:uncharacterized repeat protein (TIGR01451 family)
MNKRNTILFGLCLLLASPLAWAAQPTVKSSFLGFVDVNGNGILDCAEPVELVATYASNNSGSPALTGSLFVPYFGTTGLIYLPGSLTIDPDLTVACQATIVQGNSPQDLSAQVDFSCPADANLHFGSTVVARYRATYYNSQLPQFTATAHATTSSGLTLDDSTIQNTQAACASQPSKIALTKSAAGPATPGSTLLYTLTATDLSGLGDGGLQLVEAVPPNTTFDATASSPGWLCAPDGRPGSLCRNPVGNVTPNGSLSRFFAVTLDNPLPAGVTTIANTACVREGPTIVAACASSTTPTAGAGRLQVAKTLSSGTASPGATLTFKLNVSNSGNQGLLAVSLNESVPPNSSFNASQSSPGWSCTPGAAAGATCTLALGTLQAGAALERTFAVDVINPLPAGVDRIVNTACALAPGTPNGCDSVTVPTAGMPMLKTTKTLSSGSGIPGSVIVYDLAIQNTGNQGALAVIATETVPAGTSFSASSSPAWTCSPGPAAGSTCTLPIGPLFSGETKHVLFAVSVANPLPAGVHSISNTACAILQTPPQSVKAASDSCATITTPTQGAPKLALLKTYTGGPATAGSTLSFNLGLSNSGNQDAAAATITDSVPPHTTFASAVSSPGWTCLPNASAGAVCSLAVGGLAAGATINRTFSVQVDANLPPSVQQIANSACAKESDGNTACGQTSTPPAVAVTATLQDSFLSDSVHPGTALPGTLVSYVLVVTNPSTAAAVDLEIPTTLDPYLSLVAGSVTTSAGAITSGNAPGDSLPSVHLASLAAGDTVTINFNATVAAALPATLQQVSAQSTLRGTNFPSTVSSDPDNPTPLQPTTTPVGTGTAIHAIPTLSGLGLAALVVLLAVLTLFVLRRSPAAQIPPQG